MSVSMQFGNIESIEKTVEGFELVDSGYLGGENSDEVTLDLSQHQMYFICTREIVISSGSVRGFRARLYVRTENDGTLQVGNLYASTNSGVTMTISDETLTIKPSSTSYDVYYALYAVL